MVFRFAGCPSGGRGVSAVRTPGCRFGEERAGPAVNEPVLAVIYFIYSFSLHFPCIAFPVASL